MRPSMLFACMLMCVLIASMQSALQMESLSSATPSSSSSSSLLLLVSAQDIGSSNSSTAESSSSGAESSSTASSNASNFNASSSTGDNYFPVRAPSNDRTSILVTVFTVLGVIVAVICCERFYSSCRRTIKRRQGREGFNAVIDINPDLQEEELQLGNIREREGDDHL